MNRTASANRRAYYADRSFWGMTLTQLLGAFNDNLFKQLMLLLALKVASRDLQGVAMICFSAPFLLFSGLAGYLSDRFSKQPIIVAAKVAEIVVMLLGAVGFLWFFEFGFAGLLVVLFLMGTQSAFFGPGKYGILPELLRERDLPGANGAILMTTFLAIIFGTASAGMLTDPLLTPGVPLEIAAPRLSLGSAACVAIAVLGTATSLLVRRTPAASPHLKFTAAALAIPWETRSMLRSDRPLLEALLATCVFWLVAGLTQQAVNSFGKVQLELSDTATSLMVATIGLGIACGALLAGLLSRGRANYRVQRLGAVGCVAFLMLLSLPGSRHGHLLGFWGSLAVLFALGVATAFFAIPLQVFLQSRPPDEQKGRVIAVQNQANFAAILLSGAVYLGFDQLVVSLAMPRATVFALTSLIMLPVAVFYRPFAEPA